MLQLLWRNKELPKIQHWQALLILLLSPIQMYFLTISLATFWLIKMISPAPLYRQACENYPPLMPLNLSCSQRLFPQRKKIQSATSSSINDIFSRKIFPLSNIFGRGLQNVLLLYCGETCNEDKQIVNVKKNILLLVRSHIIKVLRIDISIKTT